jgi:hypothetical protein
MPKEDPCYGTLDSQVRDFLARYGCRLIDLPEIVERIDRRRAGRDWPGMDKWIAEAGPSWVNDMETLVFEVPVENLAGRNSLDFTQRVWMLQPSLFEYMVEEGQGIVRVVFLVRA